MSETKIIVDFDAATPEDYATFNHPFDVLRCPECWGESYHDFTKYNNISVFRCGTCGHLFDDDEGAPEELRGWEDGIRKAILNRHHSQNQTILALSQQGRHEEANEMQKHFNLLNNNLRQFLQEVVSEVGEPIYGLSLL